MQIPLKLEPIVVWIHVFLQPIYARCPVSQTQPDLLIHRGGSP